MPLIPRFGTRGGVPLSPALMAILAAYLALALLYNAATPIFEASDEFRHFLALHSIVETHHLPVLAPSNDPLTPGAEAGQPPLYYLLAAAISSWVEVGNLPGLDVNPHALQGIPSSDPDNKNLFVHSAAEGFPYRGLSLAVHLERLLSVVLGAGTVWLTYQLAEVVAPGLSAVALLAAGLVAFNPQFLFISASVDNDNLITFASTAALVVLARMLRGWITPGRLWLLSALLGVAMLSKLSGLALPVLAILVVLSEAKATDSSPLRRLGMTLAASRERLLILAVGPLSIAGWWYVRNWLTYGDPTSLSAWIRLYGGERGGSLLSLLRETPGLFISYWGVFGAFDLKADSWLYGLYLVVSLMAVAGLVIARRRVAKASGSWAQVWLLLAWVAMELAALARWTSITTASTGRLLFPAISAVAVLIGLGLLAPLGATVQDWTAGGICAGLIALAAFVPFRYLLPAYAAPVVSKASASIGMPSQPLGITYGDTFELMGFDLTSDRAKPGDTAEVDLYWRTLKPPGLNYSVTVQLLSGEGSLSQDDSLPGEGKIATSRLGAANLFRDRYRLAVKRDAPAPIIGRLMVAMYDDTLTRLPARDSNGNELVQPVIAELPIDSLVQEPPPPTPVAEFGGEMQLLSAEIPQQPMSVGGSFAVRLRWRATQRMARAYTEFVHVADDSGRPIAQHDQQPRGGDFPTNWWAQGEVVEDSVSLSLPPNTPPGRYQVLVGMYELASLRRLPASTGGDSSQVGWIEVR